VYTMAGGMIEYLLTERALGCGTVQFMALELHRNIDGSINAFLTSRRVHCR
jgi:hypothetical protein